MMKSFSGIGKQRRVLLAAALSAAVLAAILSRALLAPKRAPTEGAARPGDGTMTMVTTLTFLAASRQSEETSRKQEAAWQGSWGRDPFSPAVLGAAPDPSGFSLSGIVWDEKMPVAIVNQRLLRTGDTHYGYRVKEIKRSSVVFVSDDESFELRLFQRTAEASRDAEDRPPL